MELKHDCECDAIYIELSSKPYAYGVDLDNERRVDYSEDNTPIGIELLCACNGVMLTNLPCQEEISELLKAKGINVIE
jgi:uncharacterized protein YuzE